MNPSAIYSKTGKGVQEASGKTSLLKRADRAVLSAIDGRAALSAVAEKVGKQFDSGFEQLIRQLDRDGFVREVSSGTAAAASTARPGAARPAPPKAAAASGGGEELDFTISIPVSPSKPAAPPPPPADPQLKARQEQERKAQEDNMTRARREAEERAQREKDRLKAEAEARMRAETEAKMRVEAESKSRAEAEARLRAEAEAKVKAARETAVRLAAEAKARAEAELQAKLEAERKAREEAERARKEAEDKARREAEELRQRLEEERKAREEAERKAREEAERARKEAEEKARREAEELRLRLEAERKAREEAERKAAQEAERARKEAEEKARLEAERKAREEQERRAREEKERRAREEEERRRAEERREAEERRAQQEAEAQEAQARAAREAEEREREAAAQAAAPAKLASGSDNFADSLLADLDSFTRGDEDKRKAKEEGERKSAEAARAREEAERGAKEEARRKRRAEEERREGEEAAERERGSAEREREAAERKAKEEAARRREEEREREEAEERKRRERESARHAAAGDGDDIGVTDDDLGMGDVRQDEKKVAKESRKAARAREREQRARDREARERAREREREERRSAAAPASYSRPRRRGKWGKPVALVLFVLLVAAVGVIHVLPISTTEYENAATLAVGRPVKLGTGHISLVTGLQLKFSNVTAGDVKIASVRAYPAIGSLFGDKKAFSSIELEGVSLSQDELGDIFYGAVKSENFSVERVVAREVKLSGPLKLPELGAELNYGPAGRMISGIVSGPDGLHSRLAPKGENIEFDTVASSFTVPFAPDLTLASFAMKGSANRRGMDVESWGGGTLDGAISGTATVRWGPVWRIDGVVTVRGINAAVFAPALLSDGRAEGTAKFSIHGADPLDFKHHGRIEGRFSVNKGVLGSFDLSRAIQTGGRQAGGSTQFTDMSGEALYERGAVSLRNVSFGAGALNAGASADIAENGALSGRIVADVHASSQTLRATLNIGGTAKEPQVKN